MKHRFIMVVLGIRLMVSKILHFTHWFVLKLKIWDKQQLSYCKKSFIIRSLIQLQQSKTKYSSLKTLLLGIRKKLSKISYCYPLDWYAIEFLGRPKFILVIVKHFANLTRSPPYFLGWIIAKSRVFCLVMRKNRQKFIILPPEFVWKWLFSRSKLHGK